MRSFTFYIDRWKGSPRVRSMDAEEKIGYLNLLLVAAAEEDGGVPASPQELAILSELEQQWTKPTKDESRRIKGMTSGEKILGCWFYVKDGKPYNAVSNEIVSLSSKGKWSKPVNLALCREGRYYNAVLVSDHQHKRSVIAQKSSAGKIGATVRYGPEIAYATAYATNSGNGQAGYKDQVASPGTKSLALRREAAPYLNNFRILWDQWPPKGQVRKQKAYELFGLRVDEAPNGDRETQFAVILEGLSRWQKSAQWSSGHVNHIANWLDERLYLEHPVSAEEESGERQSLSDAVRNPGADMVRRRLDASRNTTASTFSTTTLRHGPSSAENRRVLPIVARSGGGGSIA